MIIFPKIVSITSEEYLLATQCGSMRWRDSLRDRRVDSINPKSWDDAFRIHQQGALAEIAVGKALGIYCPLHVNEFRGMQSDLPNGISVRWSRSGVLYVRPKDPDGERVVLVTGTSPDLEILGWIESEKAKLFPLMDPGGSGSWVHGVQPMSLEKTWAG